MSQQRPQDASGNHNNPPSFTPSNRNKKNSNYKNSNYQNAQNAKDSSPLPSFPPKKENRLCESNNQLKISTQIAPSFAPKSYKPRQINVNNSNIANQSCNQNGNRNVNNQSGNQSVNNQNPNNSTNDESNNSRKKHHVLKFLSLFLLIILISIGAFGALSWNWVDSQIKRDNWLTDTPDTQETTWLILGSDQREGEEAKEITGFRTDTILVLTKPVNGHSSLISIPRDSLVSINGQQMKINTVAQDLGNRALTRTVEKITGHKIDHVAQIKFAGLTNVVNSLGTIDLCYNRTVNDAYSGLNWSAGCHSVDGTVALAFSRMRYADPQSDFGRAARQRMVISAIMKKALSSSTLTNFSKVKGFAKASLDSTILDENSNPGTLLNMGLAFKDATGKDGVTGTVYWTNPDYEVYGVGSSVLLDDAKNIDLFNELAAGTHAPGSVGTLAELMNQ